MADGPVARALRGMRLAAPMGASYVPLAFTLGLLAVQQGLSPWVAALMSAIVFAGASQFAALAMLRAAVPTPEIVLATLFINLRHIVYNLSILPKLGIRSLAMRSLAAAIMTDESFAFGSLAADPGIRTQAGILGVAGTLWLCWNGGTLAGALLSPNLPPAVSNALSVMVYGMFIGLLVPALKKLPRAIAVSAAAIAIHLVARQVLPSGWAMVVAILGGSSLGPLLGVGGEGNENAAKVANVD